MLLCRSAFFVLMCALVKGVPLCEALPYLKQQRRVCKLHPAFVNQIEEFEKTHLMLQYSTYSLFRKGRASSNRKAQASYDTLRIRQKAASAAAPLALVAPVAVSVATSNAAAAASFALSTPVLTV